jgi:hypothetical protein
MNSRVRRREILRESLDSVNNDNQSENLLVAYGKGWEVYNR